VSTSAEPPSEPAYPDVEEIPSEPRGDRTTVCVFAPVLMLTVTIERRGDTGSELHVHGGGQGYWVARMASVLGADVALCTVLGGETGRAIVCLMDDGIRLCQVASGQPSAGYVHDRRDGDRSEIIRTRPLPFDRHEVDELHNTTLREALGAGICVLAGTQETDALSPAVYRRLAADLRALGVEVVADLAGPVLRAALEGGLDLLKVSDEELVADGWANDTSEASVLAGIRALGDAGAGDVVVSRRELGALAAIGGSVIRATTPKLTVVDPRGAGDSMTAALAVARAQGLGAQDALRIATAAAAANVTRHGLASGIAGTIEQLMSRVTVEVVDA
jgi:1-phosphofructokinase